MRTEIPQNIDDPVQFFFWEMDEVIPVFAGLGLGILMNALITYLIVGLAASRLVATLKKGKHQNFMVHWLYWHGVPGAGLKGYPPSYIRKLAE